MPFPARKPTRRPAAACFRAFGCIMSGALFSLSTQFTFEQGVGKRSFAEVATVRQRLSIGLLNRICGFFRRQKLLPRLSRGCHNSRRSANQAGDLRGSRVSWAVNPRLCSVRDGRRELIDRGVNFPVSGDAAEAEANGAHANLRRHAHRLQHWRKLNQPCMACGAGRCGDAL